MGKKVLANALLGVLSTGIAATAFGDIVLDKSKVSLAPPERGQRYARDFITVRNPTTEKLFLETEVYKLQNYGTKKEKAVAGYQLENMTLLVSPGRAVIPPKGERQVRILSTYTPKEKEAYRVMFKSVLPRGAIARGEMTQGLRQATVVVQPE